MENPMFTGLLFDFRSRYESKDAEIDAEMEQRRDAAEAVIEARRAVELAEHTEVGLREIFPNRDYSRSCELNPDQPWRTMTDDEIEAALDD
jgi:hypothetical protein